MAACVAPLIMRLSHGALVAPGRGPLLLGLFGDLVGLRGGTPAPFIVGEVTFEGPLLSGIMELVGGSGEYAAVTALDDYSVEVPVSDFAEHGPILALKTNGEYMPEDDKGPLFIIYDYDGKPGLNTEDYHSRSVWSVRRIELQAD